MKIKNKIGIGADIVRVNRFEIVKNDKKFLNKVFSKKEIEYCRNKANAAERFAAKFAGKEAVMKAFSAFNKKMNLSDVEIINKNKSPKVIIKNLKGFNINLSLSHERDYAVAFALITKE
ncbi:holo-ACP synthase [Candidatus Woesearchaeota archaeon]|nr:holo-ACP synthase [Candidatus Woesearchaeota archaeon]